MTDSVLDEISDSTTGNILDGIRDILPDLRGRAQETEDARQVPLASIEQLRSTGFFSMLQPKAFGGLEVAPVEFYEAVKLIASACGSTGWVASVLGSHSWHIATYPLEAQEEFWGNDQHAVASSAYAPVGRATAVEGGYRLSGRWSFSSGSGHAQGALLGGLVFDDGGEVMDYAAFLLPRTDYTIDDVWDTVGLRGTGSNDIIVDDVFVPGYRVLSFDRSFHCDVPGAQVHSNPLYRMPLFSVMSTVITTPVIGMAQGAYDAHVQHQQERVRVYEGKAVKDDPFAKVRVAQAASEIDAAWLQLTTNISAVAKAAAEGHVPTPLRLKVRRDQVRAAERAMFAIDRLFENSGARAISTKSPIQRFWRDAHAARVHVVHDPEGALKLFGDSAFGEATDVGMF